MTSDRSTGCAPVFTTWRPGLIWLSPGDESLFLYCAFSVPLPVPPPCPVVAATAAEAAEVFPTASRALTV